MVRRNADLSLYFYTADGELVRVSPGGADFANTLSTFEEQIGARLENNMNRAVYMGDVRNAQGEIDLGRTTKVKPIKPKRIVVSDPTLSDTGNILPGVRTEEDWLELPNVIQR